MKPAWHNTNIEVGWRQFQITLIFSSKKGRDIERFVFDVDRRRRKSKKFSFFLIFEQLPGVSVRDLSKWDKSTLNGRNYADLTNSARTPALLNAQVEQHSQQQCFIDLLGKWTKWIKMQMLTVHYKRHCLAKHLKPPNGWLGGLVLIALRLATKKKTK